MWVGEQMKDMYESEITADALFNNVCISVTDEKGETHRVYLTPKQAKQFGHLLIAESYEVIENGNS